jgi:hypothetical protein
MGGPVPLVGHRLNFKAHEGSSPPISTYGKGGSPLCFVSAPEHCQEIRVARRRRDKHLHISHLGGHGITGITVILARRLLNEKWVSSSTKVEDMEKYVANPAPPRLTVEYR